MLRMHVSTNLSNSLSLSLARARALSLSITRYFSLSLPISLSLTVSLSLSPADRLLLQLLQSSFCDIFTAEACFNSFTAALCFGNAMTSLLLLQLVQTCFTALHRHALLLCCGSLFQRSSEIFPAVLQLLQTGRSSVTAVAGMYTTGVSIILSALHGNFVRKDYRELSAAALPAQNRGASLYFLFLFLCQTSQIHGSQLSSIYLLYHGKKNG